MDSAEAVEYSPNNGYWYLSAKEGENLFLLYYAEQNYLVRMQFLDVKSIQPKWINEKFLFVRVWVGRVAAVDLILDVETESVVKVESLRDGREAMAQYKAQCLKRSEGCTCVGDET